jgi:YggT family protein
VELVTAVLALVIRLFMVVLLVRLVFEWVQVFARDWRPRGVVLWVAEAVYTITDPPLRALRRLIPPVTLGTIRLDLAFITLFLLCWVALVLLAVL